MFQNRKKNRKRNGKEKLTEKYRIEKNRKYLTGLVKTSLDAN
jgi:hypothetical protein